MTATYAPVVPLSDVTVLHARDWPDALDRLKGQLSPLVLDRLDALAIDYGLDCAADEQDATMRSLKALAASVRRSTNLDDLPDVLRLITAIDRA